MLLCHPKMDIDFPTAQILKRPIDEKLLALGQELGLNPVLARIIAGRGSSIDSALYPKLGNLTTPLQLADIEPASKRLAQAIIQQEVIGIETDHDCDGQTAHAVLYYNLVHRFGCSKERVRSYIGHRLEEGYGLSEKVAQRILQDNPRPALIITADNGSADEPRIKLLKEHGIITIVTDHHALPLEGPPKSAYACLNPTRSDCNYNDPYIAGCMVAWLLMAAVRQVLIEQGYLPATSAGLQDSLDFVAVGTIADCVSMAKSQNNRAVVKYGLQLIAQQKRPCWQALYKSTLLQAGNSQEIAFKVAPLLNSDGRLATSLKSVSLLLADSVTEAISWIEQLTSCNLQRKLIQQRIISQGVIQARAQLKVNKYALCIYLDDSHIGVQGIAASRVKDLFGLPTAFMALRTNEQLITGSIRSIVGFNAKLALDYIKSNYNGLLLSGGGHQGAAGFTIAYQDKDLFSKAFDEASKVQLQDKKLGPVIFTDGELSSKEINIEFCQLLTTLEPFGREFEVPVFELSAIVKEFKLLGDGKHARLLLQVGERLFKAVWFNFRTDTQEVPFLVGKKVKIAYNLGYKIFNNSKNLEISILGLEYA